MKVSVRKLLSVLCAFVLVLTLTMGMTGTGFADENVAEVTIGDKTTPYNKLHDALEAALKNNNDSSKPATIKLLKDITFIENDTWTPVEFPQTYELTFNGNNKTITNLPGMMFHKTGSGVKGLTMYDVTFQSPYIDVTTNTTDDTIYNYGAVIMGYADSVGKLYFENVHIDNATVKSKKCAGAFYAFGSGYNVLSDGPLFAHYTIKNCSVTNSSFNGVGSTGALVGQATANEWTKVVISNTVVKGNTIDGSEKVLQATEGNEGILIGSLGAAKKDTVNNKDGGVWVEATESDNILVHNGGHGIHEIGRVGSTGATGVFTVGGSYSVNPLEIYYNSQGSITAQEGYKALQRPDGTWTIGKGLTITAKDQTINYGESISATVNDVTLTSADHLELIKLESITLTPSSTDATQDGKITPSDAKITSSDKDITSDYVINYVAGKLIINKVPSTVTTAPEAKELNYTGAAQELITAGESDGGVMYYAIGDNNTTAPNFESESIPTATNAGTYYVWYKVIGDKNHTDTTPAFVTAKISEALPKISDASITVTQGQTKTLEISDSTGSGTRTWTLNSDAPDWVKLAEDSDSKATLTVSPSSSINAGSYSCNVTVTNADSKTSTAKISITVEKDTSGGSDDNNESESNNNEESSQTLDDYLDSFSSEQKASMTELKLTQEQKQSLTDSQLTTIFTEFTALETLDLSGSTQITKLDAQGSETLSSINLEGCEKLSNVDLGGCSSLSEIKGLSGNTTLKTLDTSGCSALESLDVSNCTGLTSLDCSGSSLGSLTVGGCTSLVSLNCRNNKLESLNADDCESLETLECGSNGMSKLSLKGCLNLQKLYCYSNNLESLEVPSQKLEWLVCDDNKLSKLDVSENKKLKRLDCQNNSMAALDIDTKIFTSLNWLKCYGQKIAKLAVSMSGSSYHVNLGEYLRSNSAFMSSKESFTASDTNNIQSVKGYDKDGNEIELISYDESTGSALFASSPAKVSYGYKTGYDNIIMDVSIGETSSEGSETHSEESETTSGGSSGGCNIGGSILAVILACVFIKRKNVLLVALLVLAMSVPAFCDVAVNSDNFPDKNFLEYISSDIDLNHDGALSSSEIESVTMIEVYDREIESLAGMEHFTALQELYCYGNKINSLNLSRNRELLLLECDNNTITRLDVSMNDKLINLECEMNNITELDLSNNANISYMKCYGQTRTGLVSSHDKSGSTYTVNLGQYVSDFTRVSSVSAYDGNGDIINNVSFYYETGIASMSSSPSKLRYIYDINYVNDSELSMDVTITGTAMTQNKTSKNTSSLGGSSGGCNFGVSAFALSALSLLLLMRRK